MVTGGAEDPDGVMPDVIEEQIIRAFGEDLSKEDYSEAQREVEDSLKSLTKASITELRSMPKPHHLVEKTLQLVLILRGFKQFSWSLAKEMLNKP